MAASKAKPLASKLAISYPSTWDLTLLGALLLSSGVQHLRCEAPAGGTILLGEHISHIRPQFPEVRRLEVTLSSCTLQSSPFIKLRLLRLNPMNQKLQFNRANSVALGIAISDPSAKSINK
jgi:hypothetical protein